MTVRSEQRSGMRSGGTWSVAAAGNLSSSPQCRTQNPGPAVPGYGWDNRAGWKSVS